jgi:hypothetical protein
MRVTYCLELCDKMFYPQKQNGLTLPLMHVCDDIIPLNVHLCSSRNYCPAVDISIEYYSGPDTNLAFKRTYTKI